MASQHSRPSCPAFLSSAREVGTTRTSQDFGGESAVTSSCHWNVSIITTYLSALPPPHAGAAAHRQRHAGNETGFVGSKKQRGVGDVPPGSHLLAQRHLGVALGLDLGAG